MYAFVQGQTPSNGNGTDADHAEDTDRSIYDALVHDILVFGAPEGKFNPIRRVRVGSQVCAYQQKKGYFAFGTVMSRPAPITEYEEYDQLVGTYDPDNDMFVRVQWHRHRQFDPIPYSEIGYAPRTVGHIADRDVIDALEKAFGVAA